MQTIKFTTQHAPATNKLASKATPLTCTRNHVITAIASDPQLPRHCPPPDGQTRERRQSVEVLAGMLTRTGRDARLSKTDEQHTSGDGRHLALLSAGCQRPAIQQLHEAGQVGLGRAVALAEGDASDLDSGAALLQFSLVMTDAGALGGGRRRSLSLHECTRHSAIWRCTMFPAMTW